MPVTPESTAARTAAVWMTNGRNTLGSAPQQIVAATLNAGYIEPFRDALIAAGAQPTDPDVVTFTEAHYLCSDAIERWTSMNYVLDMVAHGYRMVPIIDAFEAGAAPGPPVNTVPAPGNGPADTPYNVNGVSVASTAATLTVVLDAGPGVDQIQVLNSGTVTGNNTDQVTIGPDPAASVNAALGLVRLTPTPAFTGASGFQITSTDANGTDTDPVLVTFT